MVDSAVVMAYDQPDVELLSTMLHQCLGRIDEEAFGIQHAAGASLDVHAADRIEDATGELQEICDTLMEVEAARNHADVNAIVAAVAGESLHQLHVPIVQRHDLCAGPALAASPAAMVASAIRRALSMAVQPLAPGGQLSLRTRIEAGSVLFEVDSIGCRLDEAAAVRAETLRAFAQELGGACNVHSEGDDLYLVLQMPQLISTDPGDRL